MIRRTLLFISFILLFASLSAYGQNRGPVVVTPADTTIQLGQSVTLRARASGIEFFMWSPPQGLSTTIGPITVATPQQTITYTCEGYNPGEEKVVNGNFEQGNVGFTSGYIYFDSLWAEGTYNVGLNANTYHPHFQGSPHGGDNFMIVNGSNNPGVKVWEQEITVKRDTWYAFSTWVCTVSSASYSNPARLQFSISNNVIGTPFSAPSSGPPGTWQQFYEYWYSGDNTTATITILNLNATGDGNDFGLDDISFRELIYDSEAQGIVRIDAMNALDDSVETCADTPVEINFLNNDHVISGCTNMTCSIIKQADHGVASYQNNVITYTPDAGYAGVDDFKYRIACGQQYDDATVRVIIHPNEETSLDVVGCNEYTIPWSGTTCTQSGTYSHHYLTSFGCDSLVTLNVTIIESETYDEIDSTCTFPYHWQSHGYVLPDLYNYGHHTYDYPIGDCYATFNLDLIPMHETAPRYFVEEACDSFFWQDSLFTQSTHYELTVPQASGCDSTYVLDLTIHPSKEEHFEVVGCNEYTLPWDGTTCTQSGTYFHTYHTSFGCDSLVYLHVSIITSETFNESDSTCVFPYYWKSHGYDLDTLYDYGPYSQDVEVGDCYITFNLDLSPITHLEPRWFIIEECDSYFWQDSLFTASTHYEMLLPQTSGCDSTYVLDLTIHPSKVEHFEVIGCNEYPSPWCDSIYTQSGTYSHHYLTPFGCDSLVNLHVAIITSETFNEIDSTCVLPYYWKSHGYDLDTLYDYGHHTHDIEMGDCYATFNLDLNPMDDTEPRYFTEETCDSFFWQDSLFTQSTHYELTVPQASGCDSIYVLDLTLNHSPALSEIIPRDTVFPHYVIPSTEFFVMECYFSIQNQIEDNVDSVVWTIENANWAVNSHDDGLLCSVYVLDYVSDTVWLTARVYNDCAPDGVERRFWLLCSFFGTGEDLSQEVQVYPNPTDSKLTVQGDELKKVAVYDIYGQMLACYDNLSTNIQSIDLERFAPALYYVEVTTSRGKTIKKVVVRR